MDTFEIEFEDGTIKDFEADSGKAAMYAADVWYAREFETLLSEVGIIGCREVDIELRS